MRPCEVSTGGPTCGVIGNALGLDAGGREDAAAYFGSCGLIGPNGVPRDAWERLLLIVGALTLPKRR